MIENGTMKFFSVDSEPPEPMTQCLLLYSNGDIHEGIHIGEWTFRIPEWVLVSMGERIIGWQYMPNGEIAVEEIAGDEDA